MTTNISVESVPTVASSDWLIPSFFVVMGHTAMTCKNSSLEPVHEEEKATFLRSS